MDTHGEAAAVAHAAPDHSTPISGLRFEKVELDDFVVEDRTAGQAIGKLLAAVFLISFVLMSGVCVWMVSGNTSLGHDPQTGIGANTDSDDTTPEHH